LLAGYKAERIGELLGDVEGVRILVEPEPLGTGGALRFAAGHLAERFFMLNGDSLFDVNLWDLAELANGFEAAMALRPMADVSRYGPAVLEGARVARFEERSAAPRPGLVNGGVVAMSRAILARIPAEGAVSIEAEVYPLMARDGALGGRAYDRPFIDIGVPDDFERAQTWLPETLRRGAVIFDRDGVLNRDVNYAHRPDQIEWIEGAMAAVKAVNDAGLFAFVATNQAGVAHGLYGESDVLSLHAWMNRQLMSAGAHIDAFAYSPYHPEGAVAEYRRASDCRKPGPGMLLDLFSRFPVRSERAIMIGDRESDIEAARAAGVEGAMYAGGDLGAFIAPILERLRA
jgi:histidinol-phosphate phosphatase family protein